MAVSTCHPGIAKSLLSCLIKAEPSPETQSLPKTEKYTKGPKHKRALFMLGMARSTVSGENKVDI